jgi:hypothetical protein
MVPYEKFSQINIILDKGNVWCDSTLLNTAFLIDRLGMSDLP